MRSGHVVAMMGLILFLTGPGMVFAQQTSGGFRSSGGGSTWSSISSTTAAGHGGFSSTGASWGKSPGAFSQGAWGPGHWASVPTASQGKASPVSTRPALRIAPVRPAIRAAPSASNSHLQSSLRRTGSSAGAFAGRGFASSTSFGRSRVAVPGLNTSEGGSSVGAGSLSSNFGGSSLPH